MQRFRDMIRSIFIVFGFLCLLLRVQCAPLPRLPKFLRYMSIYHILDDPVGYFEQKPKLETTDRIKDHGYPGEKHYVTTEDGYILAIFRIPYSHKLQNQNENRSIVFMQHALFGSSDNWLAMGPDNALAFLLVDEGYDVWMGNARGNTYSRNHTKKSPNQYSFWHFSWHEIGYYDVAAMLDYILKANGQDQKSVHYVGHSQGTTAFFTLMSTRPEYNDKIKTAHLLAPVAFMKHMKSDFVRSVGPYLGNFNFYNLLFGSTEFLPFNDLLLNILYHTCRPGSLLAHYCFRFYNFSFKGRLNSSAITIDIQTSPAGVSTNQMLHYLQEQQSGHFRRFDYGIMGNLLFYKSIAPPDYPTHRITSEVHLWYSDNDRMAAVKDVHRLADTLPNKVMHHVKDPQWTHNDFTANWHTRKLINDPIIEIIQEYEKQN